MSDARLPFIVLLGCRRVSIRCFAAMSDAPALAAAEAENARVSIRCFAAMSDALADAALAAMPDASQSAVSRPCLMHPAPSPTGNSLSSQSAVSRPCLMHLPSTMPCFKSHKFRSLQAGGQICPAECNLNSLQCSPIIFSLSGHILIIFPSRIGCFGALPLPPQLHSGLQKSARRTACVRVARYTDPGLFPQIREGLGLFAFAHVR